MPAQAAGASLLVSPSSVSANVGASFTVSIMVNAGTAINSASGTVLYTNAVLSATAVSVSGSAFSFWATQPSVGSTIQFAGGVPTPGIAGSNKLFSITFKVLKEGTATVSISGGQVLANDGVGTNVYTGASNATVTTTQKVTGLTISSSTHPSSDNWYQAKTATFSWNKPSDITSFDYVFSSDGQSSKTASLTGTTVTFDDLADGVWTLTLTGHTSGQSRTASYTARIDTVAPTAFTVSVTQTSSVDPFPTISFQAQDAMSGIDHYEVTVDTQESKSTTDSSLKLDRQLPGQHAVTVKAFDKAGNSTTGTTTVQVVGFAGPSITDFSRFVSVLQPISLTGQALYGATIRLYIDGKSVGEFPVKENLSLHQRQNGDANKKYEDSDMVEWNYFYKSSLTPGLYKFSAVQVKADGSESEPSNTVTPRVLWSSINLFGLTLPLAVVSAVLGILLIALIVFLIWLLKHSRRAITNWRDRLVKIRQKADQDLQSAEKDLLSVTDEATKEPKVFQEQVTAKLDDATKSIDKSLDEAIAVAEAEKKETTK